MEQEINYQKLLEAQREEEKNGVSLDAAAEPFADMMRKVFKELAGEKGSSEVERIGYLLGKYVYFMDALDDYDEDAREGKFNAFRRTFGSETYDMAGDGKETLDAKNQKDAYRKLVTYLRKDVRNAVRFYTKQVLVSVKHESDFVMTEGYDGIRTALTRKKD